MQPQALLRGPNRGCAVAARRGAGPTSAAARRVAATATAATTATATARPKHPLAHYDVLGVGQALVDMQFTVDDDAVLDALGVAKGGRRVVTPAERAEVLRLLSSSSASSSSSSDGDATDADATLTTFSGGGRVSAGGSLANTLVGLSRLGRASGNPLRVALGGSAGGGDGLGSLARRELRRAGVDTISSSGGSSGGDAPSSSSDSNTNNNQQETGTVIVVTSRRDAQRSFLACFPPDQSLERDNAQAAAAAAATTTTTTSTTPLRQAAQSASLLALEGYMLELPGAAEALPALARLARASGARVALAAGDAGVVRRHRAAVGAVLKAGVDLVLANAEEAEELAAIVAAAEGEEEAADGATAPTPTPTNATKTKSPPAEAAARSLAQALGPGALVSVTDGSRGAYLASGAELAVVPPCWSREAPVDTTGAGDAYAAGLLFELLAQLKERDGDGAAASSSSSPSPASLDLHAMGASARRAAAAVIARVGPALTEEDAARVVAAGRGFGGGGADAPSPLVLQARSRFVGSPARR